MAHSPKKSKARTETNRVQHYRVKLVRDRIARYPVTDIGGPWQAAAVIRSLTKDADRERFIVLYLNAANAIIGSETAGVGGLHGCALLPGDVFRGAIVAGASSIIVGHNHPSGDPTPSADDLTMTRALIAAGKIISCPCVDHVIVVRDSSAFRSCVEAV